jgi:hypothetical protein
MSWWRVQRQCRQAVFQPGYVPRQLLSGRPGWDRRILRQHRLVTNSSDNHLAKWVEDILATPDPHGIETIELVYRQTDVDALIHTCTMDEVVAKRAKRIEFIWNGAGFPTRRHEGDRGRRELA